MGLLRFLFSKIFFRQLLLAGILTCVLVLGVLYALKLLTKHNQFVEVPDLTRMEISAVETKLDEISLRYEVVDSVNYNPAFPKFSVIEQNPEAKEKVKEDRIIYLTLNPAGYRKVPLPNLIQLTKRNATSMLSAMGLALGEITYMDNIGKDMVLQVRYKNRPIVAGTLVPKTAKVDLVLGNGNASR